MTTLEMLAVVETVPTVPTVPKADGDGDRLAPILTADPAGLWHVAIVADGREARAALAIRELGADAFVPMTYVKVRVARHARRTRSVQRVWLGGYVFFRWRAGPAPVDHAPRWDLMKSIEDVATGERYVRGWITFGGRPAAVHPEDMVRLVAISGAQRPHVVAGQVRARIKAGQTATLKSGPFAGFDVRVEEVRGEHAVFWVRLFGTETRSTAPLDQFVAR